MTHQPTEEEKTTTAQLPAPVAPTASTIWVGDVFRDLRPRNGRTRTLRVARITDPDSPEETITARRYWDTDGLRVSCTVLRVEHPDGSVTEPQQQTTEIAASRLIEAFEPLTVDAYLVPADWTGRPLGYDAEQQRTDLLLTHRPCGESIPVAFRPHLVEAPCPVAVAVVEHQHSCHGFVCRWCKTSVLPKARTHNIVCEACRPASTCTTCCGRAHDPDDILRLHAAHTEEAATA